MKTEIFLILVSWNLDLKKLLEFRQSNIRLFNQTILYKLSKTKFQKTNKQNYFFRTIEMQPRILWKFENFEFYTKIKKDYIESYLSKTSV